jgi:hypothetical protein
VQTHKPVVAQSSSTVQLTTASEETEYGEANQKARIDRNISRRFELKRVTSNQTVSLQKQRAVSHLRQQTLQLRRTSVPAPRHRVNRLVHLSRSRAATAQRRETGSLSKSKGGPTYSKCPLLQTLLHMNAAYQRVRPPGLDSCVLGEENRRARLNPQCRMPLKACRYWIAEADQRDAQRKAMQLRLHRYQYASRW